MFAYVAMLFASVLVAGVGVGGQSLYCREATYSSLAPCSKYMAVNSNSSTPTPTCCSSILALNTKQPDCLCQIMTQLLNSTLTGVNSTKAHQIPVMCCIAVDTVKCPAFAPPPGSSIAPPASCVALAPSGPYMDGAPGVQANPPEVSAASPIRGWWLMKWIVDWLRLFLQHIG